MVVVFVNPTETFRVYDDDIDGVTALGSAAQRRAPEPDAFGARVDRWANAEASLAVEQNSIEQVTLACPVHACDTDHTKGSFDSLHHLDSLRIDNETYSDELVRTRVTYTACLG